MTDKYKKVLNASIQNLRTSMTEVSMNDFLAQTIESLMLLEREEYLEETKEKKEEKGNGYYERAFRSLGKNKIDIHIPRTRSGFFSPELLELIKIGKERIEEIGLSLYKKGMTARDVEEHIKEMYGGGASSQKISNLAKTFHDFRTAWENTKLEIAYKVVFADVLFITVKRKDSYQKEAVFVAYGVRMDNTREIIALSINPTESATYWGEVLENLKERGIEHIDLFVADGLKGLEDELHILFPKTKFQKCVVHKMRNILNKTRPKDKGEMAEDLKEVFNNFEKDATREKAMQKLSVFVKKWKSTYPCIERFLKEETLSYYFTYIEYPPEIRRMIYTTNSIENVNRIIRKATKNKLSFESPDTLLDYVFIVLKEFEEKNFMKYPVSLYKYLLIK